jgi:hypothetical protein
LVVSEADSTKRRDIKKDFDLPRPRLVMIL